MRTRRRLNEMTPFGSGAVGAAVLALLLLGCTDGGAPVVEPSLGTPASPSLVPTAAPTVAVLGGQVCTSQSSPAPAAVVTTEERQESRGALLNGVTAEWLPGLDQRPCHAALTHSGPAVARRLATLIDETPVFPSGAAFGCPADDGSEVILFFSYAGGDVRTVSIRLSGCQFVGTSGGGFGFASPTLLTTLGSIAPLPWR